MLLWHLNRHILFLHTDSFNFHSSDPPIFQFFILPILRSADLPIQDDNLIYCFHYSERDLFALHAETSLTGKKMNWCSAFFCVRRMPEVKKFQRGSHGLTERITEATNNASWSEQVETEGNTHARNKEKKSREKCRRSWKAKEERLSVNNNRIKVIVIDIAGVRIRWFIPLINLTGNSLNGHSSQRGIVSRRRTSAASAC